MNLESFFQHIFYFTGFYDRRLLIIVFLANAIGEVGFAIPYLMETIWLSSAYNVSAGALSPFYLALLFVSSQSGRQIGALVLGYLSRLGSVPVMKFYRRFLPREQSENSLLARLKTGAGRVSPLSVAAGRLMWLRLPLTMTLGVYGRWLTLTLGVLISGLIWDGVYTGLGAIGGKTVLSPVQMIEYSLMGITALYAITFISRRTIKWLRGRSVRAAHKGAVR